MKKVGIFAFITALFSFMTFKVIDDGGAGGDLGEQGGEDSESNNESATGEQGSDVGDIELEDGDSAGEGETTLSAEETAQARELIRQNEETQMLNAVEKSIQSRIPNFNMSKTVAALRELHKTDPAKAAYYNASEAGLEMYHRDHFANVAEGDDVNSGSHSGSGDNFGDVLEKAKGGNKKATRNALANAKA